MHDLLPLVLDLSNFLNHFDRSLVCLFQLRRDPCDLSVEREHEQDGQYYEKYHWESDARTPLFPDEKSGVFIRREPPNKKNDKTAHQDSDRQCYRYTLDELAVIG